MLSWAILHILAVRWGSLINSVLLASKVVAISGDSVVAIRQVLIIQDLFKTCFLVLSHLIDTLIPQWSISAKTGFPIINDKSLDLAKAFGVRSIWHLWHIL